MDGWITQLRRGLLELCILNLLRQGESYGYELVQKLQGVELFAVSESTVYPILARLKADGFLKVRDVPSDAGPPRRYFSLTAAGRLRVGEMNTYWDALGDALKSLRREKE